MEFFLELLKLILPSFIVFLTVFYMLRMYFQHERLLRKSESQKAHREFSLPLRLQSYERLALFMERIKVSNLLLRFQSKDISAKQLVNTMMLAIQQEYEHNLVQQIYVSDKLWEIICLSKDEVLFSLDAAGQALVNEADASNAGTLILNQASQSADKAIETALLAIKKEIHLLL
ncbi:MAG: hypothetical protein IPK88_13605 [Saprospiraceae bacterium]|nr:hypothetical protein [Candidatus Defluviibacterium haderslevense]